MRLVVVTVNYCCAAEIVKRLPRTAAQIADAGGEWWIVDNKSPDDSVRTINNAIKNFSHIHLVEAPKNGGFGYGNNQVIDRVLAGDIDADYIYFLNPDAVPEKAAIQEMISYLDNHPEVGAVGSGLINEDGSHTDSMFRFPSLWSEIESALAFGPMSRLLRRHRQSLGALTEPSPVDWVAGTSFIARAKTLRAVGGFDEDFFLYWEEVELCYRIKQAGWEIHGVPDAKVRHSGGVSTGMHRSERRIPGYWHESRNLYFRKTGTGGNLPLLNIATAVSLLVSRALEVAKGAPARHPQFLRDHIRHSFGSRPRREKRS